MTARQAFDLPELREALLEAEIHQRLSVMRGDANGFNAACVAIARLQNAILHQEAAALTQEKRDELLPPRQDRRRDREDAEVC